MISDAELLAEIVAFRRGVERLIRRFPRATHLRCVELLGVQTDLMTHTLGSYVAQYAMAHILDHDGMDCAIDILDGIGARTDHEARAAFVRMAELHGIEIPFAEEEELDTNTKTMNEIMNMIKREEGQ